MNRCRLTAAAAMLLLAGLLGAEGTREEAAEIPKEYGRFNAIRLEVPADVIIQRDEFHRVEADIAPRYRRDVEIRNEMGVLVIRPAAGSIPFFGTRRYRFILFLPRLESLDLRKSGRVRSRDTWEAGQISLNLSGSADLELGGLLAERVSLVHSGAGDIRLRGVEADSAVFVLNGSGELDAQRIHSSRTALQVNGSGDLRCERIEAEELEVDQAGSGDVGLAGEVLSARVRVSGSGDFHGTGLLAEEAFVSLSASGDASLREGSALKEIRVTGSGNFSHGFFPEDQ